MRQELLASGAPDSIVDDAVLVLSELLSNSCRHARPLSLDTAHLPEALAEASSEREQGQEQDYVRAAWSRKPNGELTISVTDGGGPTRPLPATPSVTARGGRGLSIITSLSQDWGVTEDDACNGVTVWVVLTPSHRFPTCRRGAVNGRNKRNGTGSRGMRGKAALDLIGLDEIA